jgi:hypothetical protein
MTNALIGISPEDIYIFLVYDVILDINYSVTPV